MESNTSVEFIMWQEYMDQTDWHDHSKMDHMLASIAFEIRRIAVGLSRNAKMPKFEDFLPTFNRRGEVENAVLREIGPGDYETGGGLPGIEIGVTELDDKWKKITEVAKAEWSYLLGDFIVSASPPGSFTGF
jgi:hypothetical protein